ncbi:hypothetical protein VM1G_04392 [Cytospora mali]|uniref:Heterokaryon incompatibility domain-containing protein n=1 Tax=Cytospora mali TaxID=578113 RepID=A0A194VX70_CYTMA|nr:hypothetical protein VM1G_04392 [Valsa mali]
MSTKVLTRGRNSLFRHDHITFRKAVFESRCFICSHVWNSLSQEQKDIASDAAFMGIEYQIHLSKITHDKDEEQRKVLANLSFEHGDDLYDCEDYKEVGGFPVEAVGCFAILNPSVFPLQKAPSSLPDSTSDPSCLNTVSRWINDCCSKHDTCWESRQPQWKPTRLVDISEYEKGYVRVVESSTLPENSGELYLALSHCWGRKPFRVMRQDNKEEFEQRVLISSLATNFQDAIFMTRQLGFNYVWIDSLCIIQGSKEDWDKEAPMMNRVYRNAFLTLGAMASPHGFGGLFRTRDPEMTNLCPFKLRTEEGGDIDCLMVNSDFWEGQVRQAPLSQRAWVVQERILAPRSLYFCESQLFWECRQQHACELFPDGVPLEFIGDIKEPQAVDVVSVKAFEATLRRLIQTSSDSDDSDYDEDSWEPRQYESPYEVWNDIMESYAKCALTNPGDKLVAISGVVKDFATIIGDEYLAGLWRGNLINGLLWVTKDQRALTPPTPSVRPEAYRAPSWSWASIDAHDTRAQVAERNLHGDYTQVLKVHIKPQTDDPTGALKHACLHLQGRLIKTRHKPNNVEWPCFGTFIADMEDMPGEDFYCLPLREQTIDGERYLRGLVLAPCLEEEKSTQSLCDKCSGKDLYVRVGTFDIQNGDPLKYLGMRKPRDWDDWGDESDHLWFSQDMSTSEFVVI